MAMFTRMSDAKALKVADIGPKTEAQRVQAIKTLKRIARDHAIAGDSKTAKHIGTQYHKLRK